MRNELNNPTPPPPSVSLSSAPIPLVQKREIQPSVETPPSLPNNKKATPPKQQQEVATKRPGQSEQNNPEEFSLADIKTTVGEIVKDLDANQEWMATLQNTFKNQTAQDDRKALQDPLNQAWASITTAQIAQFATAV